MSPFSAALMAFSAAYAAGYVLESKWMEASIFFLLAVSISVMEWYERKKRSREKD